MKLYTAGVFNTISSIRINQFQEMVGFDYPILESYYYKKSVHRAMDFGITDLFLDSGAFSAFSLGATINLNEYIDFILKYQEKFTVIACLDVVGDADKTLNNIRQMQNAGITPLPVFHYLSPLHNLELCKEYNYLALGGLVPIAAQIQKIISWLDKCWEKLTTLTGEPTHKVHGFGMTGIRVMAKYPWFSVDSSSWLRGSQGGAILIHEKNKIQTITMDASSLAIKDHGKHFDNLSELEKDYIETLAINNSFTIDQLRTSHWSRRAFNIQQSNNWARAQKEPVFIKQEQSLL